jgi:hypothetical protein
MMKNKNFWLGMLVLVFGMAVVGCGARGIEGTWVAEDYDLKLVLNKNGSFQIYEDGDLDEEGTYTTSDNSLTLGNWSAAYSLEGNTLTFDDYTFTRQKESSSRNRGRASALVGKWVPESGQRVSSDFIEEKLELQKDGTGIGDGYSLKWTAEKGRLTFKLDIGMGIAYDYKLSGSTLTLTSDEGEIVRYKKQ